MFEYRKIYSIIIICAFMLALVPTTAAYGNEWLDGWDYRKKLTIEGATNAGINYAVRIDGSYYSSLSFGNIALNFSDFAHQGVTQDTLYVYTTNTTSVTKYTKEGVLLGSYYVLDNTDMTSLSDLCTYDDHLYIAAHNAGSTNSTVIKMTTELAFVTEYDLIEPDLANNLAAASISYHEDYFYTIADTYADDQDIQILKWDTSFTPVENWTLDSFSITNENWHYQGIDWLDDYIIMPVHEDSYPETIDVYYFDGDDFRQVCRLPQFFWTVNGTEYQSSQGISIENYFGTYYAWFASRGDVRGQVAKVKINLNPEDELAFTGRCKPNFDDIRFTASDGSTLLNHWRETYTLYGSVTFWVNVTENLNSTKIIFVYYGNDAAVDISDGDAVFPFYNDYASGALDASDWDIIDSSGSISFSTANARHGQVAKVEGAAGTDKYFYQSDLHFAYGYAVRFRSLLESTVTTSQITQMGWGGDDTTSDAYFSSYQGTDRIVVVDSLANSDIETVDSTHFGIYRTYEILRDGTNATFYVQDIVIYSINNQPDDENVTINVYCRDSEYDVYNDWALVRRVVDNEPSLILVGSLNRIDMSELYAPVEMFLVFVGLMMLPASTMYLVHGGKNELSKDKIIMAMFLFCIGLSLVLGVILP